MKNYFIIIILIFLFSCSFNKSEIGIANLNNLQKDIDSSKEYSFEEYVNLLLNISKSKKYPDINSFPD